MANDKGGQASRDDRNDLTEQQCDTNKKRADQGLLWADERE